VLLLINNDKSKFKKKWGKKQTKFCKIEFHVFFSMDYPKKIHKKA